MVTAFATVLRAALSGELHEFLSIRKLRPIFAVVTRAVSCFPVIWLHAFQGPGLRFMFAGSICVEAPFQGSRGTTHSFMGVCRSLNSLQKANFPKNFWFCRFYVFGRKFKILGGNFWGNLKFFHISNFPPQFAHCFFIYCLIPPTPPPLPQLIVQTLMGVAGVEKSRPILLRLVILISLKYFICYSDCVIWGYYLQHGWQRKQYRTLSLWKQCI